MEGTSSSKTNTAMNESDNEALSPEELILKAGAARAIVDSREDTQSISVASNPSLPVEDLLSKARAARESDIPDEVEAPKAMTRTVSELSVSGERDTQLIEADPVRERRNPMPPVFEAKAVDETAKEMYAPRNRAKMMLLIMTVVAMLAVGIAVAAAVLTEGGETQIRENDSLFGSGGSKDGTSDSDDGTGNCPSNLIQTLEDFDEFTQHLLVLRYQSEEGCCRTGLPDNDRPSPTVNDRPPPTVNDRPPPTVNDRPPSTDNDRPPPKVNVTISCGLDTRLVLDGQFSEGCELSLLDENVAECSLPTREYVSFFCQAKPGVAVNVSAILHNRVVTCHHINVNDSGEVQLPAKPMYTSLSLGHFCGDSGNVLQTTSVCNGADAVNVTGRNGRRYNICLQEELACTTAECSVPLEEIVIQGSDPAASCYIDECRRPNLDDVNEITFGIDNFIG